jgi:uncharacterized protein YggE
MKGLLTFLLFLLLQIAVFAQLENIPLITVYGEASIKIKPDYVIIGIKLKKQLPTSEVERSTALEIFKAEDTKIRLFGFDAKNISETVIQVDSGVYFKEVFLTITDLNALDKYLLELNSLGFTKYIYLDYRVKDYAAYKMQVKKEAINSARKKAVVLAAELGQTIGKAHIIEELAPEDYNWFAIHDRKHLENITFKLGADGYVIEPGFLTLNSKIKVSFDLPK